MLGGSIYKGYPANKVISLAGEPSTGKTFFALTACKNLLDFDPKAFVVYFETEGSITTEMLTERGFDLDRFLIVPVSTVEDFRSQAMNMLDKFQSFSEKERPKVLMVLDSLGMLSTNKETDDIKDGKATVDMTRAKLIRGAFRSITLKMSALNIPMIVTNHTYDTIGLFSKKIQGGGSGLVYAASTIIFLSKAKDKDGTDQVGVVISCRNEKSRQTKEGMMVKTLLNFDTGLNRYYGLVDLACEAGVFKKSSTRIEVEDGSKVYEKQIYKKPEKFFTPTVLAKVEELCISKYGYGKTNQESSEEEGTEVE